MQFSLLVPKGLSLGIRVGDWPLILRKYLINLGFIFLESISNGVITSEEMNWVTSNQPHFSRVEEATALKLGRLLDRGVVQIGCRIGHN